MKKSMIETAYEVLSQENKAMAFPALWDIVSNRMGFSKQQHDDNIAQFYSDLSIDGRFASLPGNTWDLRTRQSRANTMVDTDSLSVEDEEDDFIPEEDEENENSESSDDEAE